MLFLSKSWQAIKPAAVKYRLYLIIICLGICFCTALFTITAVVNVPSETSSEAEEGLLTLTSDGESDSMEESFPLQKEDSEAGSFSVLEKDPQKEPSSEPQEDPSSPAGGDEVWLSDVPFISQNDKYPTGCESVSAVMVCQYVGISINVDTFITSYLPYASFTYENGELIGYHPDHYFMGDPFTEDGVGCWAPCIETAIRKFLPADYVLENTTGEDLSFLCDRFIDHGIPVVVWVTMYMGETFQFRQWTLKETGERFDWLSPEHCMVLTGYDQQYYYFNDPLQGKVRYKREVVEDRFSQMGRQSLTVYPSIPEDAE